MHFILLHVICYPQEADDMCSEKLLVVSVNSITDYEYRGFLSSLVHHNGNHWKRQFCVLKDARLYCFTDMNASQAIGKSDFNVLLI